MKDVTSYTRMNLCNVGIFFYKIEGFLENFQTIN